jgi:hypothetical protein
MAIFTSQRRVIQSREPYGDFGNSDRRSVAVLQQLPSSAQQYEVSGVQLDKISPMRVLDRNLLLGRTLVVKIWLIERMGRVFIIEDCAATLA